MRPELQAKLLQHLNKKKADKGFTLVELLVVIVIIGILTAIALPSFLNQTAKAKQSEAKQNVSSVLKAQQSWRTENSSFTAVFDELALGTLSGTGASSTTVNYAYAIAAISDVNSDIGITATATDLALKGYAGGVAVSTNASSQIAWNSLICEANSPSIDVPKTPTINATSKIVDACGDKTTVIK
jgi:type IV pilus assembly protein PilA